MFVLVMESHLKWAEENYRISREYPRWRHHEYCYLLVLGRSPHILRLNYVVKLTAIVL